MVSAILFKERIVRKIMAPGKTTNHQASNCSRAPANNDPQVTMSTGTPNPKNEREDSVRMADAMQAINDTDITGKAFGNACLNKILHGEAPLDFADAI